MNNLAKLLAFGVWLVLSLPLLAAEDSDVTMSVIDDMGAEGEREFVQEIQLPAPAVQATSDAAAGPAGKAEEFKGGLDTPPRGFAGDGAGRERPDREKPDLDSLERPGARPEALPIGGAPERGPDRDSRAPRRK